jgi:hypothetical protein
MLLTTRQCVTSGRRSGGTIMTSPKRCRQMMGAVAIFAAVTAACSSSDISGEPEIAAMIGREYRVVGDVDALA